MATIGRPTEFTHEMANTICEKLTEGLSLRKICEAKGFPNRSTVFRWLASMTDFRDQYARARDAQADALADDIVYLADKARANTTDKTRIQIDARKWYASKLRPKLYGEKVQTEHTGAVGVAQANITPDQFREIARGVAAEV